VAALFVLALVPALAASVLSSLDERARLRTEAGETAVRLSRLLAARLEGMLTSTYELLRVLDEHPAILSVAGGCEPTFDSTIDSAQSARCAHFTFAASRIRGCFSHVIRSLDEKASMKSC
jgi:hypothetical protein